MNGYRNGLKQPESSRFGRPSRGRGDFEDYLELLARSAVAQKPDARLDYLAAISLSRQEAGLRFAIAVEEQRIIRDRFFDELLEEK